MGPGSTSGELDCLARLFCVAFSLMRTTQQQGQCRSGSELPSGGHVSAMLFLSMCLE